MVRQRLVGECFFHIDPGLALTKPVQTDNLGFGAQGRYDLNQDVLHNRTTFRYGESNLELDEDLCRSN